jgi:cyanate lyase
MLGLLSAFLTLAPGSVLPGTSSGLATSALARIVPPRMLAAAAAAPAGARAANLAPAVARAGPPCMYTTLDSEEVSARTLRLLSAKDASGLSWDELAVKLGLTNAYTVQLFLGQARLSASAAEALTEAVPLISKSDLAAMQQAFPMRKWDSALMQEPNVYRTHEAIMHYAEVKTTRCRRPAVALGPCSPSHACFSFPTLAYP